VRAASPRIHPTSPFRSWPSTPSYTLPDPTGNGPFRSTTSTSPRRHTTDRTSAGHGELITTIDLPPSPLAAGSLYLKFRDRESYEFALVSVCAALTVKDGVVADVRIALGGVGTKPWRARRAEEELRGAPASDGSFARAAAAELSIAAPRPGNAFKVALAERAIVRGLRHTMNGQAA